jgi:hypothetical protein
MGVRRIEDPHHPRGYRELRSNGEMRKLLNRKIVAQNGICTLCSRITKLESSRLVKEDTLCKESMTRAERAWLREHRSKSAEHWNLLTDLTVEQLDHVVL